jgi:hypothetical protein
MKTTKLEPVLVATFRDTQKQKNRRNSILKKLVLIETKHSKTTETLHRNAHNLPISGSLSSQSFPAFPFPPSFSSILSPVFPAVEGNR